MKKKAPEILIEEIKCETKVPYIFQAILEAVLGAFLIFYPIDTSNIAFIVIGSIITAYGVFDVISFITNHRPYSFRQGLFSGVLITVIGVAFIVQAMELINLLSIILGTLIIIESIIDVRRALIMKNLSFKYWFIVFIISFVIMVAGGIIVLYPGIFGEGGLIHIITGILFILTAAIDIWSIFIIMTKGRTAIKEFEKDKSSAIIVSE